MREIGKYVDMHCHPSLKPFGRSFKYDPPGKQHPDPKDRRSIWYYDPPSVWDKLLNYAISLTKFSQSNFTSLTKGGVGIVCVSLYPLEKWFVRNNFPNELLLDLGANFALGVGSKRVDFIQGITDYFQDLTRQYEFYLQLNGQVVELKNGRYRYKIVNSYEEIEALRVSDHSENIQTICVILTIEGLHVLNTGLRQPHDEHEVLQNLEAIRNWEFRPFFITIAHHFWNHICGHAESLTGLILKYTSQTDGLNTAFTHLGLKVMNRLLDNSDGKRIIPDIKHMSTASRYAYYEMLAAEPLYHDIPIIVSHGACNGLHSPDKPEARYRESASNLNPVDINFFDDEIIRIARSMGIFAIQLDERRVVNKQVRKRIKHSWRRKKIMYYRSELIWNQIAHIVKVLDGEGMDAWGIQAIGSDFDGIIDSLNGFWTAEELPFLAENLKLHANRFLSDFKFNNPGNSLSADEAIEKIMGGNAHEFLKRNFNPGPLV